MWLILLHHNLCKLLKVTVFQHPQMPRKMPFRTRKTCVSASNRPVLHRCQAKIFANSSQQIHSMAHRVGTQLMESPPNFAILNVGESSLLTQGRTKVRASKGPNPCRCGTYNQPVFKFLAGNIGGGVVHFPSATILGRVAVSKASNVPRTRSPVSSTS